MQTGKLVHLISIERPTQTQDEVGDIVEGWEIVPGFARIGAEVLPDRGSEFFAARQIQATRTAQIRLFHSLGINETMRVVHHVRPGIDEFWDIAGMINFQSRDVELRLMCVWREAAGYRRGVDLINPASSP